MMTGKELKEFRSKTQLSQTDFGLKIHATQDQLSYWERRGGALIPDWAEAAILREFVGRPLKQAAPELSKEDLGMILDEVLEDSSIHEIFERLLPWIRRPKISGYSGGNISKRIIQSRNKKTSIGG
jgi:transcriptional regulator with XRE-family HTH domain